VRRLVALCGALLLVASCGGSAGSPSQPSSRASATSTPGDFGPPPPRIPLLYFGDPQRPGWLTGYDWTGRARATLKLDPAQSGVRQSPDGSYFLHADGSYLDRLGHPVPGPSAAEQKEDPGPGWADDGSTRCFVDLDQTAFTWTLETQVPGQPVRKVAVIARDQGVGQTGIVVAACSVRNDVAILARYSIWWLAEAWTVRLSTGKALDHRTYKASAYLTLVASRDGAYVAETSSNALNVTPEGALSTLVRRLPDWSVVGALNSGYQVLAFSGDDSTALVARRSLAAPGLSLAAIALPSGRVMWWYDGVESLYRWTSHPDGPSFAVALRGPSLLNRIVILGRDGTPAVIPGALEPVF
jgi:hypothetical protein